MAVQKVFKRYEYKYLLTREQKELLQNVIEEQSWQVRHLSS